MAPPVLRVTYSRFDELRDDYERHMVHGGLLVKITETADLQFDAPVALELVLPDGAVVAVAARVLQILGGLGVAVSLGRDVVADLRGRVAGVDPSGAAPATHQRFDGNAPPPIAPRTAAATGAPARREAGEPSNADKIHKAIYGSRDERNAILRDKNRSLHPYVLKSPLLTVDDVLAIAKNAQMTPELLKQIAERKEWLTRPAIATALARNPKTPPDVAVRALEFVPLDALRQMAKGGVLPHVTQAARKRLLG